MQDLSYTSKHSSTGASFETLAAKFSDYAQYELNLSKQTVAKYRDGLRCVQRSLKHLESPSQLDSDDITLLKRTILERGVGPCRLNGIIFALRRFLVYCRDERRMAVLDPQQVKPMKVPRREVEYLSADEARRLLLSISTSHIRGLRVRALMELLLASGMRISEALSLNRADINWEEKETVVIGKGNKQRTVFLTDCALHWLKLYLDRRDDDAAPLFVTIGKPMRLPGHDLAKQFRFYATRAGIKKRVTPHLFRHTNATLLLQNGCDIRYIQELLGHSDIQTTAQYYLGTDKRAIKEAHRKFLTFTA